MFKELSIVLRGWLFRFLLQSVPWTLGIIFGTAQQHIQLPLRRLI
jgi:hypothetical protein